MCRLQFELYLEAWKRSFDLLNFSPTERQSMPLVRSVAIPGTVHTCERWVGRIRFDSSQLQSPNEYVVIAFRPSC